MMPKQPQAPGDSESFESMSVHESDLLGAAHDTPHLLVIEDDADFRRQLSDYFEYLGWAATIVAHADPAEAAFARLGADLILCDVMLPGRDGFDLIAALRKLPGGEDVPVVMISAFWQDRGRFEERLRAIGAVEFLRKPLSILELGRRLAALLEDPEAAGAPSVATRSGQFRNVAVDADVLEGRGLLPTVGSFRPVQLVDLLIRLFEQRRSGTLTLSGDRERELWFLDGYPVWAESTEPREDLPALLVSERLLPLGEVPGLLLRSRQQGRPVRALLLEDGRIPEQKLLLMERRRIKAIIQGAFAVPDGYFEFVEGDGFAAQVGIFEHHPVPLLWQVLQAIPLRELAAELGRESTRLLVRGPQFDRLHSELKLPAEVAWLDGALAEGMSIQLLLEQTRAGAEVLLRAVWLMLRLGIAQTVSEDRAPLLGRRLRPGRTRPPTLLVQTNANDRTLTDESRRVLRDYLLFMNAGYYQLLGVSETADGEQIRAAWRARAATWRPVAVDDSGPPDVRVRARELLARLAEAHDTLADPEKRAVYDSRPRDRQDDAFRGVTTTERLRQARQALTDRRFEDAMPDFRAILRRHPLSLEALVGLARCLYEQREAFGETGKHEALELIEQGLDIAPDEPELLDLKDRLGV